MSFVLTVEHVKAMLKGNKEAKEWHPAMVKIFDRFGINTPERIAGFIAQCGHESNNFTVLEENLNYSKSALDSIFPKYFKKAGRVAKDYERQPEKIANIIYASRMGNGDEASGDGWKFRGRGCIQLTGRDNYTAFGKDPNVGRTPDEVIGYVQQKQGALASACWYWNSRNINTAADAGDIVKMTKLVNGGTIGLEDRKKHYEHALAILGGNPHAMAVAMTEVATVLRQGDTGPLVAKLQTALANSGVDLGTTNRWAADGNWGPITTKGVKAYQKAMGLKVDGIVGQVTMKQLRII
jgi:putative chitinase